MEENKIPTYSDFKIQKYKEFGRVLSDDELAIKFAKMHVKKALEAAKNHCEWRTSILGKEINFTGVEESYTLENIK